MDLFYQMTAQPSQETVKPEPEITIDDRVHLGALNSVDVKPTNERQEARLKLIAAYRSAATQKLEEEKAELQEQVAKLKQEVAFDDKGIAKLDGENLRLETELTALRSQLDGMTKALREIKTEKEIVACMDHLVKIRSARDALGDGRFGIGAHNDHEAVEWRKLKVSLDELLARREAALTTQPQPVAGQKEGDAS